MPPKRRKGKQGATASRMAASALAPPPTAASAVVAVDPEVNDEIIAAPEPTGEREGNEDIVTTSEGNPSVDRDQKMEGQVYTEVTEALRSDGLACPSSEKDNDGECSSPRPQKESRTQQIAAAVPQQDPNLVLTSEKRRGVYECDYCHSDISQLPRIRCAVCSDFDLCLSCFATVDHQQALQRLKAQASAHQAVGGGDARGSAREDGPDASISLEGSGVSVAALGHDASHGYRVCDSTRYPLFPTSRNLSLKGIVQSLDEKLNESTSNVLSEDGKAETKQTKDELAEGAMEIEENESLPGDAASKKDIGEESINESKKVGENIDAPTADEGISTSGGIECFTLVDDPRSVWTVEEDLRLLDGIKTHGLGNWTEVSDAVSGHGSTGKTAKRCMERYLDDFLGRYGHILPAYTLLEQDEASSNPPSMNPSTGPGSEDDPIKESGGESAEALTSAETQPAPEATEVRSSKRRAVLMRSPSSIANLSTMARKKFKAFPTETLPGYQQLWQHPYLPEGTTMGQEVGRDQAYKAEQNFVKLISQLQSQQQVEELRREWEETRLFKPGGPTVLPMRPEDVATLPGAELAGFMPRRGDFDIEWGNDAEDIIADMEFIPGEPAADRELKLKVLAIYNAKLEEREKRKRFVLSRKLYDYRAIQLEEQNLPQDDRDLIHRMRLFERFHTPAEHTQFISDLLKAKRLRKEVAKLQMYRRIGIRTLAEAEMYELDKSRRAFHKATRQQKVLDTSKGSEGPSNTAGETVAAPTKASDETISSSLWRQYRTSDRKVRKSITRGASMSTEDTSVPIGESTATQSAEGQVSQDLPDAKPSEGEIAKSMPGEAASRTADTSPMDVDSPPKPRPVLSAAEATEQQADRMDSSQGHYATENRPFDAPDDMSTMPGYHYLSSREVDLCRTLKLTPRQYLDIKRVLLQESLAQGLLDTSSAKRSIAMIDAERRGDVIDFMVRSGWISSTLRPKATNVQNGGGASESSI